MRLVGQEDISDLDTEGVDLARRQLTRCIERDESALLFLQQASTLTNPHGGGEGGLLQCLIDLQRDRERPIYLVPHLIVWDLHPEKEVKSLADTVFGQPEAPGFLRTLVRLMRNYRNAMVKVADPIDLSEFIKEQDKTCAPEKQCLQLEEQLHEHLFREVFDVTGPKIQPFDEFLKESPKIQPFDEFLKEIFADARIQSFIREEAKGNEQKTERLQKEALDMLDEIAAEPRMRWTLTMNGILNLFWKRMYEGVVVGEEGFDTIRKAVRKAPVVFCPSHKSHVDYLIISQLCLRYKVPVPHIAAGVNLSFWPMGPIFRHSGAFFMRRSFKGNALYPIVFRTYLRYVMNKRFPIEFFIEGGRSRTGKLLPPKYGILSWLVEAFGEGENDDLLFLPISVDYEKIVEGGSYLKELSGGEKKKENVAGLIRSGDALRSKYGKIYVQVAEPISLKEAIKDRFGELNTLEPDQRRTLVQSIAHRILFDINRVSTVTPSTLVAFCLLNHRLRGMSEHILRERAAWVLKWLRRRDSRLSQVLDDVDRGMAEATARFSHDGLVTMQDTGLELVFTPVERKRLALDYYRNNLIHHFVPAAILLTAVDSFTVDAVPLQALSDRIRELSRLFKHEFLFRSEKHFTEVVESSLSELEDEGILKRDGDFVLRPAEGKELRNFLGVILQHFLEAGWLTLQALKLLSQGPMHEKDLLSKALQLGDHLYVQGEILLQESISRAIIKNFVKLFEERGLLSSEKSTGRRGRLLSLSNAEQIDEQAQAIRRYLNR
ncbi:MAG: 1-acyl-sn-glycerol-3-phosphate acyltransferase [Deltaproteobacteria bacterium]|nr:1-acyl-sn-glycerol-3-phosphate acyltransferase [Deltaproteobacteria bacterium]